MMSALMTFENPEILLYKPVKGATIMQLFVQPPAEGFENVEIHQYDCEKTIIV